MRRSILGKVLKTAVLKITGLNRCIRIAVGSAPVSEKLLDHFQKLGIDILNGYGLTEAPLVTINRVGANRINTVGEPCHILRYALLMMAKYWFEDLK